MGLLLWSFLSVLAIDLSSKDVMVLFFEYSIEAFEVLEENEGEALAETVVFSSEQIDFLDSAEVREVVIEVFLLDIE
jgi:hypothetical protein